MKNLSGILFALVLLASCQEINRGDKPDDLISEDKMVDILTELSLLHGARSYNKALMEEKGINPYPYLTEKYKIDSTQLVQSSDYYAQNYRQYKTIYDRVRERLELLMAEYDSLREAEEKKLDSLRIIPGNDTVRSRSLRRDTIIPRGVDRALPVPVSRSRDQQ